MTCADARSRFVELQEGTAGEAARRRIEAHLAECRDCVSEWEWAEVLRRDLLRLRTLEPPAVDVVGRVMRQAAALPLPSSRDTLVRLFAPWAAVAGLLLAIVGAAGWAFTPFWAAEAARAGGRVLAKAAGSIPTFLSAAESLARAAASALRVFAPDASSLEAVSRVVLGSAFLLCAAAVAASILVAGREWRSARPRSGAGS